MMKRYNVTIAKRLKEYRKENGLSMSDLGALIGVSAQAVCKWEQEKCYPDIVFLPNLANLLSCTVDDFFECTGGDAHE